MRVRVAALVAVDAPSISYLTNLAAGGSAGVEADDVQQVFIGIALVVGTGRVASPRAPNRVARKKNETARIAGLS